MYHSHLLINTGDNPDRPDWNITRRWLRNLYRVHQRLCMAFPSRQRKADDPRFLQPYQPAHFAAQQVHIERRTNAGFLFRIDRQPGGRVIIAVQSAIKPDWDYAFHNAQFLLAGPADVKPFDPVFDAEQVLRFRLLANPTKKVDTKSRNGVRNNGKRVPVPIEGFADWLTRRAEWAGFIIDQNRITVEPGYVYVNRSKVRSKVDKGQRLRSARFDGVLTVTNVDTFRQTLVSGIGPAKAFGFGLLSIARR